MDQDPSMETALNRLSLLKMQSFRARLMGLHSLSPEQRQRTVLWFPNCRSVHSFFLTTRTTIAFLDAKYQLLQPQKRMVANRCYWNVKARHVLEFPDFVALWDQKMLQATLTTLMAQAIAV